METGRQRRGKADCRHGFAHALVNLGLRQLHVGRAVGNILCDGLLEQLVLRILEHQTDAEARFAAALALGIPDGLAVERTSPSDGCSRPFRWLNDA